MQTASARARTRSCARCWPGSAGGLRPASERRALDPLAHTLFGASLAETGLRRLARSATPALILGANLPDIDAFAPLVSSDFSFGFRRGWTHGVLALATLPAVLVVILALVERRRGAPLQRGELRRLWLLATGAAISHPLLDWLNTYGVRFLMPFDGTWFYGDTLLVIDPWFWLLAAAGVVSARSATRSAVARWSLLGALTSAVVLTLPVVPLPAKLAWCVGLVAVAAGGRVPHHSPLIARAALAVLLLYVGTMRVTGQRAAEVTRTWLESRGADVTAVIPNPMPGDPSTWRMVATTREHHRELFVRWLSDPVVSEAGRRLPILSPEPDAVAKARPRIPGTLVWARIPSWELRGEGHRCLVVFRDLRYTWEGEDGFAIERLAVDDAN